MPRTMAQLGRKVWRGCGAWALLLSLLLPFLAAAQSLSNDDEALLPACCRSHGKHKCFMLHRSATQDSHEHTLGAPHVSEKCPCVLPAGTGFAGDQSARPTAPIELRLPLEHLAFQVVSEPADSFAFFSTNRQRGPPVSSLFA